MKARCCGGPERPRSRPLSKTHSISVSRSPSISRGTTTRSSHRSTETIGDPAVAGREYGQLWDEATNAGAFDAATRNITFGNCQSWDEPVNCESLKRAENRFGDGNGVYSYDEQQNAFNSFYDSFFGTQSGRFYATRRHVRLGFELNF